MQFYYVANATKNKMAKRMLRQTNKSQHLNITFIWQFKKIFFRSDQTRRPGVFWNPAGSFSTTT